MSLFIASEKQREYALTILRVVVGVVFVAHGSQKLFSYGLEGTIGAFSQMGIPFAGIMAPFIVGVEILGGAALILGLLTRLAGLGLALSMLGAFVFVHAKNGFFMPNGYEFVLVLAAASFGLALAGSGAFSIDSVLAGRRNLAPPRSR